MAKSSDKSSEPELIPQPHGGALQRGNPGNSGGGRPPNEFKRRMREMASNEEALSYLLECLKGGHGPKAAVAAHKHVTERGYGKVPQAITGPDGGPIQVQDLTDEEVRKRTDQLRNRILASEGASGNGKR